MYSDSITSPVCGPFWTLASRTMPGNWQSDTVDQCASVNSVIKKNDHHASDVNCHQVLKLKVVSARVS